VIWFFVGVVLFQVLALDLKTKYSVACELREMIDTIRDSESARVIPPMIPVILEVLRSGKVSFQRETTEYDFRRVLLDILHRIPSGEAIRPQAMPLFQGMLYLLRHDNEENGVTCCKSIVDIVRTFKVLTEELVTEFMSILHEMFRNARALVQQVLSEDSPRLDPNTVMPSIRSFKVLAEMGMVVVSFIQSHRTMVSSAVQTSLPLNFEVLSLESPAQKKAREDYEAMGGIWSGIAPSIKNTQAYGDLIGAQIKVSVSQFKQHRLFNVSGRQMVSYLAYVLRGLNEQSEAYGEALVLTALRLCQDCPAHSLSARRVSPRVCLCSVCSSLTGSSHCHETFIQHQSTESPFGTPRHTSGRARAIREWCRCQGIPSVNVGHFLHLISPNLLSSDHMVIMPS
jgi:transformation/transcription domain-associated protein